MTNVTLTTVTAAVKRTPSGGFAQAIYARAADPRDQQARSACAPGIFAQVADPLPRIRDLAQS